MLRKMVIVLRRELEFEVEGHRKKGMPIKINKTVLISRSLCQYAFTSSLSVGKAFFFFSSFRLIPKKLMSSYTGMEECQKQTQPLREQCKNNL